MRFVRRVWHFFVGHDVYDSGPMEIRYRSCGWRLGRDDWP